MSDAPAPPVPPAPDDGAAASGAAIAYDKVAQAAALIVQDAADYQRNALALCTAAQGKALALMLQDPAKIEQLGIAYVMAMMGSAAASTTAALISEQAAAMLRNFPRG